MKNVHLIPTDKPSRLFIDIDDNKLKITQPIGGEYMMNQNIYITSDLEISGLENNIWVYNNGRVWLWENTMALRSNNKPKKIILTTDPILIQSGVQEIDEDFLEWLVQNPSCDSVKIDLVPVNEFGSEITVGGYGFDKFKYKIIPKEEPKQETLEEAAKNYLKTLHGVNYKSLYHFSQQQTSAFINGAKSEAARNYWFEEFQNKLI
jgi:hypothetical protein